ncbi:hypothetical protein D3C73_577570 [compost metagenome]
MPYGSQEASTKKLLYSIGNAATPSKVSTSIGLVKSIFISFRNTVIAFIAGTFYLLFVNS